MEERKIALTPWSERLRSSLVWGFAEFFGFFFSKPVLQSHEAPRTKFSINVFRGILISDLLNVQIREVSMQTVTCTKFRKVCQFHILSTPKENILRLIEAQRYFQCSPMNQKQSLDKKNLLSITPKHSGQHLSCFS